MPACCKASLYRPASAARLRGQGLRGKISVVGLAEATKSAIQEHLNAFNSCDRARLLDGLAEDVVWATGTDVWRGREALAELFDEPLWGLHPHIEVVRLIVEDDAGAAECVERMTIEGQIVEFPIAVFFTVRRRLLSRVKVFREGSADLEFP